MVPVSLAEIEALYSGFQQKIGLPLKPAELGLVYQADKYQERGEVEKAKEMLSRVLTHYPESLMSFVRLGDIEAGRGNKASALEYYQQFLRIRPESPYIQSKIKDLEED